MVMDKCPPTDDALTALLPSASCSGVTTHRSQLKQLERLKGWKIQRVVDGTKAAVFQMGSAQEAISEWRSRAAPSARVPPKAVVRSFIFTHTAPTLLASSTGHLWDARNGLPCDLRQYAALMQLPPSVFSALQDASSSVTGPQMRCARIQLPTDPAVVRNADCCSCRAWCRSLLGQGVHGAVAERVFRECRRRMGTRAWGAIKTFASLGAGARYRWHAPRCTNSARPSLLCARLLRVRQASTRSAWRSRNSLTRALLNTSGLQKDARSLVEHTTPSGPLSARSQSCGIGQRTRASQTRRTMPTLSS